MNDQMYHDWRVEFDEQGIAWLFFDKEGENANTLSTRTLKELHSILSDLREKPPVGMVLASGKKSGFIAGADLKEIQKLENGDAVREFVGFGQKIADQISELPFPTLAMIQGFCMGGGMELALACDYRIAQDTPDTRLGLPEVLLGIMPGWGGSIRLPRIVPIQTALDMLLSGRALRAKQAYAAGLVDAALPERVMRLAAQKIIMDKPEKRKPPFYNELFRFSAARKALAAVMEKQINKRVKKEHYPAPYAILDHWKEYGTFSNEGFRNEIDTLERLSMTEATKNLIKVFFLQESLKADAKTGGRKATSVHVIGAGTMGGDIAIWCAMQGLRVTLQDTSIDRIANVIAKLNKELKQRLKKDEAKIMYYRDHLIADLQGEGVRSADVIIEAVFEDLAVKQKIFQDLEMRAKPDALLATNTSSIPIDEINVVMKQPSRLLGIHFFNPVAKMQLVEVVFGEKTDSEILKQALYFVGQIKKLPLAVKSSPGFLVNRVLTPYLLEAVALYEEGVPPALIDKAATDFGMPMGPVELADVVGLDICLSVAEHLKDTLSIQLPQILLDKVKAKNLGKKSGKGFYTWNKGKVIKPAADSNFHQISKDEIQNRLILRFLNETMACWREEIVTDPHKIDAGIIFATGFAPFRGGPLNYAQDYTFSVIYEELLKYESKYGPRFKPDSGWIDKK